MAWFGLTELRFHSSGRIYFTTGTAGLMRLAAIEAADISELRARIRSAPEVFHHIQDRLPAAVSPCAVSHRNTRRQSGVRDEQSNIRFDGLAATVAN